SMSYMGICQQLPRGIPAGNAAGAAPNSRPIPKFAYSEWNTNPQPRMSSPRLFPQHRRASPRVSVIEREDDAGGRAEVALPRSQQARGDVIRLEGAKREQMGQTKIKPATSAEGQIGAVRNVGSNVHATDRADKPSVGYPDQCVGKSG